MELPRSRCPPDTRGGPCRDGHSSQGIALRVDVVHVEGAAHKDGPVELAPGGFVDQVEPHAHSTSRYPEQGHLVRVTSEYLEHVTTARCLEQQQK